jgi:aminopeptidase N
MNPANITRAEAMARSLLVAVESYQVRIDLTGRDQNGGELDNPAADFSSTSTIRFSWNGQPTWVDLIAETLVSATLDGKTLPADSFANSRIQLPASQPGQHELVVVALCQYSHTGEGLHRFVDPVDSRTYLYSQFEPADARRLYANFEQPDLKATFQLTVIAPEKWAVISNSAAPAPTDGPWPESKTWQFAATPRISTYITALVAGEYHVEAGTVHSRKGDLPASLVCRQSVVLNMDSERLRTTTQRGFEVFEKAFDREYPFDSYDQVFAPEYNMGAMENAGCVTLRDEYLFRSRVTSARYETRDNTILHELAHMWFGDLVTMRWWDDLWLNESFAEWASHYAQEQIMNRYGGINPWVSFTNGRKAWAFREDQLPTTHPIAADMVDLDAVEQNFDGITYAKGASVLKQLVAYVGEKDFLLGVGSYFNKHAWGNSQFSDLLEALQQASGKDLSGFSADWLESSGMNTLTPQIISDENGIITSFTVVQTASPQHPQLRHHRMVIGCYDLVDDHLVATDHVELEISGERTEVGPLIGRHRSAMIVLNDRDLTFAKARMDDQSLKTAQRYFAAIEDPLARAVVWTICWDMWRDAELGSTAFVDLVLASLPQETDMTAVSTRSQNLLLAVTGYADPARRTQLRRHATAGIASLLAKAAPCGDYQVALADLLIRLVDSKAGAELIGGWLQATEVPNGLTIDTDRRWAILASLARMGSLDHAALTAELNLDKSITGSEQAAAVRAAWKDPSLKAEAWRLATEDPNTPNETHRAICSAFWQYGQEDMMAEYAEKYLQVCEQISAKTGMWATQGNFTIENVVSLLWPSPLADAAYCDRVAAWLETHGELATSVAKLVSEQLDISRRTLRAQAANAAEPTE